MLHEVNWANLTNTQRVEHCPPHFTPIYFSLYTVEQHIANWLHENCAGRFYLGDSYVRDADVLTNLGLHKVVAFENPEEATYFTLMLGQINQYTDPF